MTATARCSSCKAPIEWAWTDQGKRIPLDVGEVSGGNLQPFETYGAKIIVRVVGPLQGTRRSHFATCPDATEHRKSRT